MQSVRLSTLRSKGWPLVALIAGVAQVGCYKPHIKDGGFKCNFDAGIAKACPEGFKCDSTGLCWRTPRDGGLDSDVSVERTEVMPEAPEVGPVCFDARPDCTPRPGLCDPFCRTGCGCKEKCSVNTVGDLTCNEPRATGFPRPVLQDCMEVLSPGTSMQTDNCALGSVCIDEGCYPRCFQFCQSDTDCANSSCSREVGGVDSGQKVCDVPFVDCVPMPGGQNMGCGPATGTMACYLSSSDPTHTICDCPFKDVGSNGACMRSRDCIKGLACVDQRGDGSTPVCLQVCRLSDEGQTDCPSRVRGSCHPYYGVPRTQPNPIFGYCS